MKGLYYYFNYLIEFTREVVSRLFSVGKIWLLPQFPWFLYIYSDFPVILQSALVTCVSEGICQFYQSCLLFWHKVIHSIFLYSFLTLIMFIVLTVISPLSFLILQICVLFWFGFFGQFSKALSIFVDLFEESILVSLIFFIFLFQVH